MEINNRRYIGCKYKLLDFINDSINELGYDNSNSFADIFAGTGVVGYKFALEGYRTIMNDNLYSNFIVYNAFLGPENINKEILWEKIEFYNSINPSDLKANYFSKIYGGKYFNVNDAKKIGYIRDLIEEDKKNLNFREYCYLLTSLIYTTDRIANTVGHFESFLKKEPIEHGVFLEGIVLNDKLPECKIYNEDANKLAKRIKADIVYIDPPYNARQYVNFYHVLENLARWNKPTKFEGNSMKFERNDLKSGYCRKNAAILFEDLIESLNCKLIVVSYSNTYTAKSTSSVNLITEDQIFDILSKKGKVKRKEVPYKTFNAGKTNLLGHKEFLYICEVQNASK